MKKRILALLLTLALVLPAVSCDVLLTDPNAPVNPSDSQSESNNNTPDTEKTPEKGPEVHTQPQTPPDSEPDGTKPPVEWPDEPQDSEQIDPPVEPETETELETEEPLPYVEKEAAGMKGHSFDTFFANGKMYFEQDGQAGDKLTAQENKVVFKTGEAAQSIALRGWIGFDQAIDAYGYYVDTYEFFYDEAFTAAAEDAVIGLAGEFATRFQITAPLTGLTAGEHKVGFIVKLADGTVVRLREEILVTLEKTDWNGSAVVKHQSFDELFYGEGRTGVFAPGASAGWNFVATFNDFSVDTLYYWGWIAYVGELGQFGYQINGGEAIYNDEWAWETGEDVVNAAKGTGADGGRRMQIAISLAGLLGENHIRVLYKAADGTVVVLNDFTVILPARAPFEVPEHTDETILLGDRGNGGPFSGMNEKKFGQRFNIGENFLKSIIIKDMAAYAQPVNTWAFRIWAWDTDYATTTAAEPIFVLTGENQPDNTTFTVADLATYGITGDFFYEVEYVSGDKGFTGWKAEEYAAEGVQTYVEGELVEGTYTSSLVVGVATPDTPDEPVVEYYENLVIDMATLGGTGFRTDFVPAGYNAPLQLLGYAVTIDLGNIDLSKYSAVKITYGCDGGAGTEANFADASSLAIGLKSQNTSYGQETTDNFDGDIAHTDMVFSSDGWASGAREAVVDLTNVDYSGNVWVAVHNPKSTEIAISAIEFIGAEKTAEPEAPVEPEEPETPKESAKEMTIPEALEATDGTKVIVTGTVKEINTAWNEQYNNITVTIVDAEGVTLYIYRMKTNVKVGDVITVTGEMATYGGSRQIAAGATAEIISAHTCTEFTDATCTAPKTCTVCGATEGSALGHNYVEGSCDRCGAAEPSGDQTTLNVTIADFAAANGWENSKPYTEFNLNGDISVTAVGTASGNYGVNTGKYYTNGENWRIYQAENPALTITAAEGKTIVSVKITYASQNTGVLTLDGANVESASVVTVNAATVTFSVGNTGTATNGQARITAIEVIYQ